MHPVVVVIVLVSVLLIVSWYKRSPKHQQRKTMKLGLIYGGIGLLLVLLLTGKLHPLFAAIGVLVPVAMRLFRLVQLAQVAKALKNTFKAARGPTPGRSSDMGTRFLRVVLNHDTGEINGEILEGPFHGSRLSDLSFEQLLSLLAQYRRAHAQSATVLEAYLDRTRGAGWRDGQTSGDERAAPDRSREGTLSHHEAYEVLGIVPNATREEIIEAHRRLIQKLHPDRGGSNYLAAKINNAKDLLLSGRSAGDQDHNQHSTTGRYQGSP